MIEKQVVIKKVMDLDGIEVAAQSMGNAIYEKTQDPEFTGLELTIYLTETDSYFTDFESAVSIKIHDKLVPYDRWTIIDTIKESILRLLHKQYLKDYPGPEYDLSYSAFVASLRCMEDNLFSNRGSWPRILKR